MIKEKIIKIKSECKKKDIHLTFLPDIKLNKIKDYYTNLDNYVAAKRCTYPWHNVRIDPNGNVYPCYSYSYGNIKKKSFLKIINSKKAKKFRQVLRKLKIFPDCRRCCTL